MNTLNAILIDPFERTVSSVQVPAGDSLDAIYGLLKTDIVEFVRLGPNDGIFVDEEGLLRDMDAQAFFTLGQYPTPFAGRALLVGDDGRGGQASTTLSVANVNQLLTFMANRDARVALALAFANQRDEAARLSAAGQNVVFCGPSPEDILPDGYVLIDKRQLHDAPGRRQ